VGILSQIGWSQWEIFTFDADGTEILAFHAHFDQLARFKRFAAMPQKLPP
jgi:hypothetical protein